MNTLKVASFRKYDVFFSLPKRCAKNYPEKDILKLCCVQSQLTLTALQCPRAGKFKIQSLGQNTAHFLGNGNNTNIFPRISDLQRCLEWLFLIETDHCGFFSCKAIYEHKIAELPGIYPQTFYSQVLQSTPTHFCMAGWGSHCDP